jgi:hypothetical protein
MNLNTLEMEWTDTGCVAKASGFPGKSLLCPHCGVELPRDMEHRCGDKAYPQAAPRKKRTGKP